MGNHNDGIICNVSPFPIQYIVYGKYQQLTTKSQSYNIASPKISASQSKGLDLTGFEIAGTTQIKAVYAQSFIRVLPGRSSRLGLIDLNMDEHKLSIRIIVESKQMNQKYQNYIINNVVIRDPSEIRLKIRKDLSIKQMQQQQIDQILEYEQSQRLIFRGPRVQQTTNLYNYQGQEQSSCCCPRRKKGNKLNSKMPQFDPQEANQLKTTYMNQIQRNHTQKQ